MKKILLTVITFLGVISVQAQKNSILIGGDFGYERKDNFAGEKTNSFSIAPVIAYEFSDNWFIGAKSEFKYSSSPSHVDNYKIKDYDTKIGGFLRYNHNFNSTFAIYGDLGAGYLEYRSDTKQRALNGNDIALAPERIRDHGYYIDFTPALFVNFKNNFGLNISIGGIEWTSTERSTAADYDNKSESNKFNLTFGKALKVGVSKKFSL